MAFPDWVEAQKKRGYEIKEIKGNYYMYERKSRYDKAKKKAVKVTGDYIGVITPEGLVPKKARFDKEKKMFSVEYGASNFLYSIAGDLLDPLERHFGDINGRRIWATSMLRLIAPCPFGRVEDHYVNSWMKETFPKLALSGASLGSLVKEVGNDRRACAAFMRETMQPAPYFLIDGSRVNSKSCGVMRAMPGHSGGGKYIPQMNQIYIVSVSGHGDSMPAFYRNVPGNIPDISAFDLTLEDAGVTEGIILADNGFASGFNFEDLEGPGHNLKYIMPLKRNTAEVALGGMEFEEYFSYHNRAIKANSAVKDGYRICTFCDTGMQAKEIGDFVRRAEKANAIAEMKRGFDPEKDIVDVTAKTKADEANFGIIVMRTNILDKPPSYIYNSYKVRWEIEQMFDTLRNACDQDSSYMHDDPGFEGWSFFGHLTVLVACRILAMLRERGLLKFWSLRGVLDHFAKIHKVLVADEWHLAEVTKKTRDLASSLGYDLN